jgi:hypothetical protein
VRSANYSITAIKRPAPVLVTLPSSAWIDDRRQLVFTGTILACAGTVRHRPTPTSVVGLAYLRWHHESAKTQRIGAGESKA